MSNSSKYEKSARYDKYIDLFGKSGDNRVKWYLQWYEENVGKTNIDMRALSNATMIQDEKHSQLNPSDTAPEVLQFFSNVSWRIHNEANRQIIADAAAQLGNSTDEAVVKLDNIVWGLITRLGQFKDKDGNRIYNRSEANKITKFDTPVSVSTATSLLSLGKEPLELTERLKINVGTVANKVLVHKTLKNHTLNQLSSNFQFLIQN
jgi:hypothetical protein